MKCPYVIKVCTKCKRILVANTINFARKKGGLYNLCSRCKICDKKYREDNEERIKEYKKEYRINNPNYNKQYYEEHKEELKEYHKQYRENNKDEISKKCKKWRKNNKEYCKKYRKKYYENNKECYKEKRKEWVKNNPNYSKKYHENNKEREKEYRKQYEKDNPDKIFNSSSKRRFKIKNQGRGITKEQWLEMMNFFDWKCAYSGVSLNKDNRSIDHIISLNNNGLNEPWNCVPMLRKYNSSKNTSDMIEWYIQQDFYSEERLLKIYEWQEYAFKKWGKELIIKKFIEILKYLINKEM